MAAIELDPVFVRALRLLNSKSKVSIISIPYPTGYGKPSIRPDIHLTKRLNIQQGLLTETRNFLHNVKKNNLKKEDNLQQQEPFLYIDIRVPMLNVESCEKPGFLA